MKKSLQLVGMALLVAGCSESAMLEGINENTKEYSNLIEFANTFVENQTRASLGVGQTFQTGAEMAVYGFQQTDTLVEMLFDNQMVECTDGKTAAWTYSPKKPWNRASTYEFYGFYPYDADGLYEFDEAKKLISISSYTVKDAIDEQEDLMIAQRNYANPFNTVHMNFNHILSNVNFYAQVAQNVDMTGISSIDILELDVTGVANKGSYVQKGWANNHVAEGAWTVIEGTYFDFPAISASTMALTKERKDVAVDMLLMPQTLFFHEDADEKDPVLTVAYKISYEDGTSTTMERKVRLSSISGVKTNSSSAETLPIYEWLPNNKYNYIIAINPEQTTRKWDIDWDGSANGGDKQPNENSNYNPDDPNVITVWEDKDDDGEVDEGELVEYPIAWEDIDGDGMLEGGIDRDNDGEIDDVDGDDGVVIVIVPVDPNSTDSNPTDGDSVNNPDNKDGILVYVDTDGDGEPDDWRQLEKDPETGVITPEKEQEESFIEFSAEVIDWVEEYDINYNVQN